VLAAGPLVTFGFLVVPTLAARLVAQRMLSFSIIAGAIGVSSAFFGFYAAYRFDLPLGPAEVATACAVLAGIALGRAAVGAAARPGGTVTRHLAIAVALGLVAASASGCTRRFTAPPSSVARTPIAVLPPFNRTGDVLLVAGGSMLDKYVFKTEKITVPEVMLAETRTLLEARGFALVAGDTVAARLDAHPPTSATEAAQLAASGALHADVLFLAVRQWTPDDATTPHAVIASVEATLVSESGTALWQADFHAKPIPTPGAIDTQTAYVIATQKLVADIFAAWDARSGA
jgi:hypothetical protein